MRCRECDADNNKLTQGDKKRLYFPYLDFLSSLLAELASSISEMQTWVAGEAAG